MSLGEGILLQAGDTRVLNDEAMPVHRYDVEAPMIILI